MVLMKAQKFLMVAATIILLIILGIVVFMRYVFHKDFFGYDELAVICAYYMYFFGASYAMYEGTHVRADIIVNFFPVKVFCILKSAAGLIQTALSVYITYLAYKLCERTIAVKSITASYSISYAIPQAAIFMGFILMTFYMGIYTIMDVCDCGKKLRS